MKFMDVFNANTKCDINGLQYYFVNTINTLSFSKQQKDFFIERAQRMGSIYTGRKSLIVPTTEVFGYEHCFDDITIMFSFDVTKMKKYVHSGNINILSEAASFFPKIPNVFYDVDVPLTLSLIKSSDPLFLVPFFSGTVVVDGNHRLAAHIASNSNHVNYCVFPVSHVIDCLGDTFQQYMYQLIMDLTNAFSQSPPSI